MLIVDVPGVETFDERTNLFVELDPVTVTLEHSLVSLSKWESKYQKSFLESDKTVEELTWYLGAMILTPVFPPGVIPKFSEQNMENINSYISAKMTATHLPEETQKGRSRDKITAELIYYWMFSLSIPMECQNWHINRLLTLIRVCNFKNQPEKKRRMSRADIIARNREINARRRAELGSSG